MRTLAIIISVLMLLGCTAISGFIAGGVYNQSRHEQKQLDKIINCLKEDGEKHKKPGRYKWDE